MNNMDTIVNALYGRLTTNYIRFRPCINTEKTESYLCRMCANTLEYAYMENRLYVLRCTHCGTLHMVKAKNPAEAASVVGFEEELEDDEE